ncbi:MAG: GNAT family N-acetyltransferase [Vicinamibacterales bacterium]
MRPDVTVLATPDLSAADLEACRRLMDAAFTDFTADDWAHALGGWHAVVYQHGEVIAHGSVVARRIRIGDADHHAGYVEAVAVSPALQRHGLGTLVMGALHEVIRGHFEVGVLSTGAHGFYERLGWQRWRGPTFVRQADGELVRSLEEDAGVMVLPPAAGGPLDLGAPIACDVRAGDSW